MCHVVAIYLQFATDVTGQDSHTFHLNLIDRGTAGTSSNEMANRDYTSGTNESAFVERTYYSPSGAGLGLVENQVLSLQREKVGNGMDMPAIFGYVEFAHDVFTTSTSTSTTTTTSTSTSTTTTSNSTTTNTTTSTTTSTTTTTT